MIGNHEGYTPEAAGYWDYFYGPGVTTGRLGDRPAGYYTAAIGSWRFIGLDSECDPGGVSGGCDVTSPQYQWLKSVLEHDTAQCTSSPTTGRAGRPGADIPPVRRDGAAVGPDGQPRRRRRGLGHNHVVEAFKPIGVSGTAAQPTLSATGIQEFTAGVGGNELATFNAPDTGQFAALIARAKGTFGVLKLVLKPGSYDWGFVPIPGSTFTNSGTNGSFSGSGTCH